MSGAVAFYGLLALAPFGVIAVSITGWLLGKNAAREELLAYLKSFVDLETATFLSEIIDRLAHWDSGWWATTLSVFFLLFTGARLFWMLRAALNYMWGFRSKFPPGFRGARRQILWRRLVALAMVFILGGALFLVAILRAGFALIARYFGEVPFVYRALEWSTSIVVLTGVILLIFRWLPAAKVGWKDACLGAFITSVFATLGAFLFGYFVALLNPASIYGAAGSLIVLLLWVYYTAQIFFFGAAFTEAWALLLGSGIEPRKHAIRIVASDMHPIFSGQMHPVDPDAENSRASGGACVD